MKQAYRAVGKVRKNLAGTGEIAFLGIPASSRRRISLALVLLAMWFLLFSRVHGEKNRSWCGAEWEYRRCRRAMLGTGAYGAETQYRTC